MQRFDFHTFMEWQDIESGTPTSAMRVRRPAKFDAERAYELLSQLNDPEVAAQVKEILRANPELQKTLASMVHQSAWDHPGKLRPYDKSNLLAKVQQTGKVFDDV